MLFPGGRFWYKMLCSVISVSHTPSQVPCKKKRWCRNETSSSAGHKRKGKTGQQHVMRQPLRRHGCACGFTPDWDEGSQGGNGTALGLLTRWGRWPCSASPETEGRENEKKNHLSDRPFASAAKEHSGSQSCSEAQIKSWKCWYCLTEIDFFGIHLLSLSHLTFTARVKRGFEQPDCEIWESETQQTQHKHML